LLDLDGSQTKSNVADNSGGLELYQSRSPNTKKLTLLIANGHTRSTNGVLHQ
jgi:hypothetical protein